jgi:hypothetical protein
MPETPKHTNALIHEKSPYLLQHAHNPVNWMPWGDAAFEKARAEDKPILLSSGYSTCHWCHVMEHESFENEETAAVMNDNFVCIKLDREERPDIDLIYMTYVQAASGHGGWPLNVFLTTELKPFYGGTYYPPETKGRIGWKDLLKEISKIWKEDHAGVMERARTSIAKLQEHIESEHGDKGEAQLTASLDKAYNDLSGSFDYHEGGFSSAPKFPRPSILSLLFRLHLHFKGHDQSQSDWALEMALRTLRAMANGGMRDHLGGGFHRYSVDGYWHVPHYEKMLYDQAQLLSAYVEGWQLSEAEFHAQIAKQIVAYVKRDLTHPDGGFYSAEDADSFATAESEKKTEGAFYVWTAAEIDELLGKREGSIFRYAYGARKDGNARHESDPHGELKGLNTLFRAFTAKKTAEYFKMETEEVEALIVKGREILLAARNKRPRPHLDDKIITAWNGLMIAGLARAGAVFDDADTIAIAERAAQFIHDKVCTEPGKGLRRSWRDGEAKVEAFAIDYACLIHGLIELHQATLDERWLKWALAMQSEMDARCWDAEHGGWFSTHTDSPNTIMRMKEDYDGAEPSPNSLGSYNLVRLALLTENEVFNTRAKTVLTLFHTGLTGSPSSVPMMTMAFEWQSKIGQHIALAGNRSSEEFKALLKALHQRFLPHAVVLHADDSSAMKPVNGKAAAYVCSGQTCKPPVTTADDLVKLLE